MQMKDRPAEEKGMAKAYGQPTRQGCSASLRPAAHALRARHPLPHALGAILGLA